ncbi:hypothetical protein A1OE_770 [Candidatus Endolissoclinum faulkneri L2]|uniref:Uncharacterized protein n=1 Tax=Candidatus Endolissoclinum faulkneri L2 TaxID=1193729 RepID=K7YHE2_9PROT|nr:hypothetical protein A1OE_770 [Candidatus Endolissoclinum faulkneri L2]
MLEQLNNITIKINKIASLDCPFEGIILESLIYQQCILGRKYMVEMNLSRDHLNK